MQLNQIASQVNKAQDQITNNRANDQKINVKVPEPMHIPSHLYSSLPRLNPPE
jgi:hypothetical protein